MLHFKKENSTAEVFKPGDQEIEGEMIGQKRQKLGILIRSGQL